LFSGKREKEKAKGISFLKEAGGRVRVSYPTFGFVGQDRWSSCWWVSYPTICDV